MFTSIQNTTFNSNTAKLTTVQTSNIGFEIPGYRVYIAESDQDKEKAYRLRHEVYCKELNWVAESENGLEIDEFDSNAKLICVENDQQQLIGTIRVVDSTHPWLVGRYFPDTISGTTDQIKQRSAVEVSRNAILPEYRHKILSDCRITVLDLLLATAVDCAWDLMQRRHILVTATPVMGIILKRRGGATEQVGPIVTMPDNCKVASFLLDLEITRDTYSLRHSCIELHEKTRLSSMSMEKQYRTA